jgi:polyhydroxybutyrate depolymerase
MKLDCALALPAALALSGCFEDPAPSNAADAGPGSLPATDASSPVLADDAAVIARDAAGPIATENFPFGESLHTLTVDGNTRRFIAYVPTSVRPEPTVVLVFHGFTMSAEKMTTLTSWEDVADREGFVVLFANGNDEPLGNPLASPWNVGDFVCGLGIFVAAPRNQDDFGYVSMMLDTIDRELPIDRDHVYASGFSMGGYFAHHLACNGPTAIRAISAHSSGTYSGECTNGPSPVLVLHGDSDTLIWPSCGDDAARLWVSRNECPESGVTHETVANGTCERHNGCPGGNEVLQCSFQGMDHGWAGAAYTGPWITLEYGGGAQYENAAELSWTFFQAHR